MVQLWINSKNCEFYKWIFGFINCNGDDKSFEVHLSAHMQWRATTSSKFVLITKIKYPIVVTRGIDFYNSNLIF